MVLATHTTPTSCVARCTCGADLTNEVHYAKEAVGAADKTLIELRNSGVSEQEIQEAQAARHAAQERYDTAFRNFVDFTTDKELRIAHVDEQEAVLSDDDADDAVESEESDEEGGSDGEGEGLGTAAMLAPPGSGDEDEDEDDDDEDGEFKPE